MSSSMEYPSQRPEKLGGFARALQAVRGEVSTALEYGKVVGVSASLLAIAGILYWCPRCGQWMGEGSEGKGAGVPKPEIPPPPRRLLRALGIPLEGEPTPTRDMPRRDGNKLTPNSGILEDEHATFRDRPAKNRYHPPSDAHARKVDTYFDGSPRPDSYPHAHVASFQRGDGEEIPLYERQKDGTVVYDNGSQVVFKQPDGSYEWATKNVNGG